jgi:hypothetical protein
VFCDHAVGKPCVFTWFWRKGYKTPGIFTCFATMQSANHVFLRGFGVRAIKPQVFLRVLWPYSPQTMHFYVGFGAGAIGVPFFLHVLWFFLRQTMYFYVVSVQGATGVVGKRCIFALFRCRGYRGPGIFACFVAM